MNYNITFPTSKKYIPVIKYSIVIGTYNLCDEALIPCLNSIFKYTDMPSVEIIISANGCTDNTKEYLSSLQEKFNSIGFSNHLKIVWNDDPIGYSKANNEGIKVSVGEKIILLNNDIILLEQNKNDWIELLNTPFEKNENCGISGVSKCWSEPANRDFLIFFCVMIDKKVFDTIGLLNEEYGKGGGEDCEFCIEAENAGFEVCECLSKEWSNECNLFTGAYPIYHPGEKTMHNTELVPDWNDVFLRNSLKLAKKYNRDWYRWKVSNNYERAVYLKGDIPDVRETTRYKWANENLLGKSILEIGCSDGYGRQFLPEDIEYTGLDYCSNIIEVAKDQEWIGKNKFINGDINTFELGYYSDIIAFEVIEHISNGIEIVEKLKNHCDRLMITVPFREIPGTWGTHHRLHNLDESHFPGFTFKYIDEGGNLLNAPNNSILNLMVCIWTK